MVITCEKCGEKYQIDQEQIDGEQAMITCESCNNKIIIPKPSGKTTKKGKKIANPESSKDETWRPAPPPSKKGGIGLRGKMFFLFFFVPICLIVAASLYYLNHMKTLSTLITKESYELVTKMAEQAVAEKGRAVAREVKLYMETHPNLKREDFIKDPKLKEIAIQKIGETGYTLVVSRENEQGQSFMWVHPKDELVGIDIIAAMKKRLGPDYERWYKVQGKEYEVCGYYKWIDGQEKYTCGIPIAETTDLNIAGAVYLGEFTQPMEELEARANAMTEKATRTVMIILVATALLIALFVAVYSYQLSGRLKYLANAADRISIGDLDTEIVGTKSKDEIGLLTSALGRMQASIRLALKRLRERKR
jgi:HAMP domain-containing protein/DNA-directed RNA polymerase subunit RPC12/RpoP